MSEKHYAIIGGSSAIARKVISTLLDQDHRCTVISRSIQQEWMHPKLTVHQMKILDEDISSELFPDKLDGFIYFPGSINLKPFKSFTPDQFREDYELNVIGAVKTLKAAEKALKNSVGSSIVFFSTVAVQKGMPYHSLVSASKGAVEGLARSLAAEWAPHVRVNCIAPSLTDTPLAEKLLKTEKQREASEHRHPLKKIGTVEDLLELSIFLLSNRSRWITGQVLHIDGGMSTLSA